MAELTEVPPNCIIATMLPQIFDTPENKKAMPGVDPKEFDDLDHIASLVKTWCNGESRPENRSFVTFEKASKKITFPKYV